jgi:hypothetical protein
MVRLRYRASHGPSASRNGPRQKFPRSAECRAASARSCAGPVSGSRGIGAQRSRSQGATADSLIVLAGTVRKFASHAEADAADVAYWRAMPETERILQVWRLSRAQWGDTEDHAPRLDRTVTHVRRR